MVPTGLDIQENSRLHKKYVKKLGSVRQGLALVFRSAFHSNRLNSRRLIAFATLLRDC